VRSEAHAETTVRILVVPTWATVVLTLGASALTAAAALGAVWLQNSYATRRELRRSAERRRERGGEVLARVMTLLQDLQVDTIAMNMNYEGKMALTSAVERWVTLRDPLATFWSSDDSKEVFELGPKLQAAIDETLNYLTRIIRQQEPGARHVWDENEQREAAMAKRAGRSTCSPLFFTKFTRGRGRRGSWVVALDLSRSPLPVALPLVELADNLREVLERRLLLVQVAAQELQRRPRSSR